MQTARKYLSACALGGCIYAAGGMTERRVRLGSVERLDPREVSKHVQFFATLTPPPPQAPRRTSFAIRRHA